MKKWYSNMNISRCLEVAAEATGLNLGEGCTFEDVTAHSILDHASGQAREELRTIIQFCEKSPDDQILSGVASSLDGIRRRLLAASELAEHVADAQVPALDQDTDPAHARVTTQTAALKNPEESHGDHTEFPEKAARHDANGGAEPKSANSEDRRAALEQQAWDGILSDLDEAARGIPHGPARYALEQMAKRMREEQVREEFEHTEREQAAAELQRAAQGLAEALQGTELADSASCLSVALCEFMKGLTAAEPQPKTATNLPDMEQHPDREPFPVLCIRGALGQLSGAREALGRVLNTIAGISDDLEHADLADALALHRAFNLVEGELTAGVPNEGGADAG